jgi:cysteinyl-tRNA synthetase
VYQLDRIDPRAIAASGFDLAVVDYSADGSPESAFSPDTLDIMKRKPDGSRRIVLAYMSIGEAEDYRFYWQGDWSRNPPPWLDAENPDWPGNYKVRYWDSTWQSLIFGGPEAYLDRILDAGFDGVYLDIIDAFEYYEDRRPSAESEMVELVRRIAAYGRGQPGREFYVIPQNGERLLANADYLEAVDGIAKEDLFWGYDGIEAPTPQDERDFSVGFLERVTTVGKAVLTVDYPLAADLVGDLYQRARLFGFIPYSTVRDLDRITVNSGLDPVGQALPRNRRLPGQFFALTAPKGVVRANLTADYWSEDLRYGASDLGLGDGDDESTFAARSFNEKTITLTLGYGLSDKWEIGLGVPVIGGHFERTPDDGLPGFEPSTDHTGIGNLRLFLATSTSWEEGDKNVLSVLEVALPTDSRGGPFGGGAGEVRISINGERYWNRLGVIGSGGATVYLDEELSSSETVGDISIGLGAQAAEPVFASLMVTREGSAFRAEVAIEALLRPNWSLEVFTGGDITGVAEARSAGVALNIWFAASNR